MQIMLDSKKQNEVEDLSVLPLSIETEMEGEMMLHQVVEAEDTDGIKNSIMILDHRLAVIEGLVSELKTLFEERLRYDRAKEETLRMLSTQIEETTPAFHNSLKKGLINSLLLFYDHIKDVEHSLLLESVERKRVASLRQELLDRLSVEGVGLIQPDSNKFDSRLQRATANISTDIPEEDLTIAEVKQDGFSQNEKIIRPQLVIVRRFHALTSKRQ